MKKFFLSLLWDCNENCVFCAKGKPPPGVKRRFSLKESLELIARKRREGCDLLSLDGGEPTLLSYLPDLVRGAARLGYAEIMLLTNAAPLADGRKVRALKAAYSELRPGQRYGICVSLHSHEAGVSDALTRAPGGFARTLRGLDNLAGAGLEFALYHVITALNYAGLPGFSEFVLRRLPSAQAVTFSYIYPTSHTLAAMGIYPCLTDVQPYFARAVARLEKAGLPVGLSSCGVIPLCLMGGNERLFIDSFMRDGRSAGTVDSEKSEAFPFFTEIFNRRNKSKAPACRSCALDPVCGGIWNFYAETRGTGELKPYGAEELRKFPRRAGTAVLPPEPPGAYDDPLAADLMRLLDARLRGWTRARLAGRGPAGPQAARLKSFAANLGYSALYFGPAGRRR